MFCKFRVEYWEHTGVCMWPEHFIFFLPPEIFPYLVKSEPQTGAESFGPVEWRAANALMHSAFFRQFLSPHRRNLLLQLVGGRHCYSNCIAVADARPQYNRRQTHNTRVCSCVCVRPFCVQRHRRDALEWLQWAETQRLFWLFCSSATPLRCAHWTLSNRISFLSLTGNASLIALFSPIWMAADKCPTVMVGCRICGTLCCWLFVCVDMNQRCWLQNRLCVDM